MQQMHGGNAAFAAPPMLPLTLLPTMFISEAVIEFALTNLHILGQHKVEELALARFVL